MFFCTRNLMEYMITSMICGAFLERLGPLRILFIFLKILCDADAILCSTHSYYIFASNAFVSTLRRILQIHLGIQVDQTWIGYQAKSSEVMSLSSSSRVVIILIKPPHSFPWWTGPLVGVTLWFRTACKWRSHQWFYFSPFVRWKHMLLLNHYWRWTWP